MKYRVCFLVEVHADVLVDAESENEAKSMASDEMEFHWRNGDAAGWSVDLVQQVEDA